jgi:hypothetical protein
VEPEASESILENVVLESATVDSKNTYQKNKKSGVYYTGLILDKNPTLHSWKTALLTRKRDDLADCFLQGIWYMKHRGLITMEDYEIRLKRSETE